MRDSQQVQGVPINEWYCLSVQGDRCTGSAAEVQAATEAERC